MITIYEISISGRHSATDAQLYEISISDRHSATDAQLFALGFRFLSEAGVLYRDSQSSALNLINELCERGLSGTMTSYTSHGSSEPWRAYQRQPGAVLRWEPRQLSAHRPRNDSPT